MVKRCKQSMLEAIAEEVYQYPRFKNLFYRVDFTKSGYAPLAAYESDGITIPQQQVIKLWASEIQNRMKQLFFTIVHLKETATIEIYQ